MLPAFTPAQWLLAILAAFCIGFSKSGFPGASLVTVIIMAHLFGARESTGALLPMLICGDILSVRVFHQHARWALIRRMLPPTAFGIVAGYVLMLWLPGGAFRLIIGWIVLTMVILQAVRRWRPEWYGSVPHSRSFAVAMGIATGFATMLANAAGPIMVIYLLAMRLPKSEFVGTGAWYFFLLNLFKVPFSVHLGLITPNSLLFNAALAVPIFAGAALGRWLVHRIPEKPFTMAMQALAVIGAVRLLF